MGYSTPLAAGNLWGHPCPLPIAKCFYCCFDCLAPARTCYFQGPLLAVLTSTLVICKQFEQRPGLKSLLQKLTGQFCLSSAVSSGVILAKCFPEIFSFSSLFHPQISSPFFLFVIRKRSRKKYREEFTPLVACTLNFPSSPNSMNSLVIRMQVCLPPQIFGRFFCPPRMR